ncbi:MAG TPA: hypothetical protein VNT23_06910 [Gaiellaceae bacterium]|nr:hypothetical protein [Gaiellaceae bacterium]
MQQRHALGLLFVAIAAGFALVGVAAARAGVWAVALAAGALAVWMAGLAARGLRRR